jgi:hypothetical protein
MAVMAAKLPLVVTHAPGHMFVTDRLNSSLEGGGDDTVVVPRAPAHAGE